jgi:hypothetical protein
MIAATVENFRFTVVIFYIPVVFVIKNLLSIGDDISCKILV